MKLHFFELEHRWLWEGKRHYKRNVHLYVWINGASFPASEAVRAFIRHCRAIVPHCSSLVSECMCECFEWFQPKYRKHLESVVCSSWGPGVYSSLTHGSGCILGIGEYSLTPGSDCITGLGHTRQLRNNFWNSLHRGHCPHLLFNPWPTLVVLEWLWRWGYNIKTQVQVQEPLLARVHLFVFV